MQYKSSKYKYISSKVYEPKKKINEENPENNFMNYEEYLYQYQQQNKINFRNKVTKFAKILQAMKLISVILTVGDRRGRTPSLPQIWKT